MESRFQRADEAFRNYAKMQKLKYAGDIEQYLTQLEALNVQAGLSGVALKALIRHGLPKAITDNMARDVTPTMPDIDFVELARRCGQQYEYQRAQEKEDEALARSLGSSNKKPSTEAKPPGNKPKSRKGKERANPTPDNKQGQPPKTPSSTRYPVVHTDEGKALQGVSIKTRAERKKKKQCQRCGGWKHDWPTCTKEAIPVKVAGVAQTPKKRKEPDQTVENPSPQGKKQKVAATASTSTAPLDSLQRLGQVFADEEEMLDYEVRTLYP